MHFYKNQVAVTHRNFEEYLLQLEVDCTNNFYMQQTHSGNKGL